MRRRLLFLLAAAALPPLLVAGGFASGCSSNVDAPDTDGGAGGGGGTIFPSGPTTDTTVTTTTTTGGADAFPDYVDPGCPDAGPPMTSFQCDPYDQNNGQCQPGEGCYIFVQYPQEPCEQETYGSFCQAEGFGQQGEGCNGAQDCSGGFICVVSGSGTQCVELCPLEGNDGCPDGFVCEPIDVEGFGGCL